MIFLTANSAHSLMSLARLMSCVVSCVVSYVTLPSHHACAQPTQTQAQAQAQATPHTPNTQWAFSNQLAVRYNPLGLQNTLYMGYKQRLYQKPQDNLLFGKSF